MPQEAQADKLITDFLFLLKESIKSNITDIHISSGDFPFVRNPSRHVEPLPFFGKLQYNDILRIIRYMDDSITEEIIVNRDR